MNPLVGIIPAKARKYVYAVLTAAVVIYGLWQASDGDWRTFVGSVVVALTTATAASNVKTPGQ